MDTQLPAELLVQNSEGGRLQPYTQVRASRAPGVDVDGHSVSGDEERHSPSESLTRSAHGDSPRKLPASPKVPPHTPAAGRVAQSHVEAVVSPVKVLTAREIAEPQSGPRDSNDRDNTVSVHPADIQVLPPTIANTSPGPPEGRAPATAITTQTSCLSTLGAVLLPCAQASLLLSGSATVEIQLLNAQCRGMEGVYDPIQVDDPSATASQVHQDADPDSTPRTISNDDPTAAVVPCSQAIQSPGMDDGEVSGVSAFIGGGEKRRLYRQLQNKGS